MFAALPVMLFSYVSSEMCLDMLSSILHHSYNTAISLKTFVLPIYELLKTTYLISKVSFFTGYSNNATPTTSHYFVCVNTFHEGRPLRH